MSGARYISSRVVKMLYAHSGNECANPSCHAKLVYVEDNAKDEQICHIEAASSKGPRYNPNQTEEERNGYDNLILLCHKCHDMIDHNPEKYTVELLKQWKKEHEDKYINTQKAKVFRTSIPDGLLPRDNEVDKLFDGISDNRVYNLIGVGGSGKSSLAYMMIQKYKDLFNEIAYVVVNTDIKQNIADQLNRTLKFELKKDLYPEIISHLQENFKSVQPNLLVLDINETADKDKIDNFITEILQDNLFLDGWKFLILTRENVDTRKRIPFHSLKDEDGFDFLKKLFLDRAGERYEDFGDFETLFKVIFYNPLLAEQLGFYLSNEPQTATIDDIKTILYGSTFREEDMQGMSAQRHDETFVSFLKHLIVYDKLDKNEQTLLRHFVLWQSDYISYDVIADLLKGVFETDSVLKKVLKNLTSRSIIDTTVNDDKVLCYKLHGLLAFSLREQIDFDEDDWIGYLDNVGRIIEYSYYRLEPYVDCIGNSLCDELHITTDCKLLYNVASRMQDFWKIDYADILYNKIIILLHFCLSNNNENPILQCTLAQTHNSLALLFQDCLRDYETAKSNYDTAIKIYKQLPEDNPEYQDRFADVYNNLALLQEKTCDFESAKSNFEKAIVIRIRLPKDLEYQNGLANVYNNLAGLQKNDHYKDFESAKSNYEKAIAILEQLPKTPKYQCDLAGTYNNLALLQKEYFKDYESARINHEKAIEICEQLPKDEPEYLYSLVSSYYKLALWQQMHLKDYKTAIVNYKITIEFGKLLPTNNPEYQNGLAGTYNNIAVLHKNNGDYDLAESNYKNAIAIFEQLPKNNPEYQDGLATAHNNLAILQMKQKKYVDAESNAVSAINIFKQLEESLPDKMIYRLNSEEALAEIYLSAGKVAQAKEIIDRIQPLAKKCLAESPDDEYTIIVNKDIDKLLEKYSEIFDKKI